MPRKKTPLKTIPYEVDMLSLLVPDTDIFPVHKPDHYVEILGIYNMMKLQPMAYQIGHRFYWKQRKGFFYATSEEILTVTKPLIGTYLLWMPSIDDMIMNAQGNGITVSIQHTLKNKYYQTFTALTYDALYPELGNVQLSRFASMDAWFSIAFACARAFRRRMEEVGLESIKPVLYLSDPDFLRFSTKRVDQFGLEADAEERESKACTTSTIP